MGIATPKTGAISFSQLNTGILNAGSTAQLDLNTAAIRLGYGSTSQVSMSNLFGCTGGTMTIGFRPSTKFVPSGYGYDNWYSPVGSITGATYYPAPQSSFVGTIFDNDVDSNITTVTVLNADITTSPVGYQGTDITRISLADAQRTILGTPAADASNIYVSYTMPTSGTITWGLKFG